MTGFGLTVGGVSDPLMVVSPLPALSLSVVGVTGFGLIVRGASGPLRLHAALRARRVASERTLALGSAVATAPAAPRPRPTPAIGAFLGRMSGFCRARLPIDPWDLLMEHLLDGLQRFHVLGRNEHSGEALAASAAGAPDAVDIVLRMDRNVVVEDVADVGDVQPSRRHVAGSEEGDRAVAESLKRGRPLMLVQIPMQRAHIEAVLEQRAVHDAHVLLAIAEDDGVLDVAFPHQRPERLAFSSGVVRCLFQPLHDGGRGGRLRRNLDALRPVQEVVDQALDLGRHGCREEQRLAGEGEELADALDVGDEPHVEHAVGLVDHQDLDAVEQELAALEMVEQPAGRGDHHIGATIELAVLLVIGHPADQKRHGELMALAENLEMLGDLGCEFARGLQDERPRHPRPGAPALEPGQHRQDERGRLAGPGLGNAQHVATRHHKRYGLRLNRGRGIEAGRRHGGHNLRT